jgi:hypothetical protein
MSCLFHKETGFMFLSPCVCVMRMSVTISGCIDDPVAYTRLHDSIFNLILLSQDADLAESRKILQKIERRELYKCVGETTPMEGKTKVEIL